MLDRTVYGEDFNKKITDKRFSSLESYISENHITEENLVQLDDWCNKRRNRVFLTIYKNDKQLYESPITARWQSEELKSAADADYGNTISAYTLSLSNGNTANAYLYYFASDVYYYWTLVASIGIAFFVFSFLFISFVHHKLRYIKRLKKDLDILAGGDLEHTVRIDGKDELGELAFGLDQMRRSILTHQAVEEEMRSSNSKLVTAMSHDLRTPLTSLLAYLELMNRGKYQDEEQLKHFISRSLGQTLRIKDMADQLFEYFLVYSTEWEPPEMDKTDVDMLFQQTWSEYAFSLESQGFTVNTDFETLTSEISVNLDLIRRVFDNLYSNLLKYADPAYPIHISFQREGSNAVLIIQNTISPSRSNRESTNLGLNTCERITKYHNGTFETIEQNHHYTIRLALPLT